MDQTKETKTLLLKNQLCFPLYAAARKIIGSYTPYLKRLGITYTQYIVMLVLWEENAASVGHLCSRLHLDSGTLTPVLKKLQTAGYIKKERSIADERVVQVSLTKKGEELRRQAVTVPQNVGDCLHLTKEEAEVLYSLLYKVLDSGLNMN